MSWSRTPYRNPREYGFTNLDQPAYAYLNCAPGCQGSQNDPRFCTCVCRGINHGIAWSRRELRPVPVPHGYNPNIPLAQLPELTPRLTGHEEPIAIAPPPLRSPSVKRRVGRSFVHTMTGHVSADEKNERILLGLQKQFGSYADTIVTEAFTAYFSEETISPNRPELYELEENGSLDEALKKLGKTWVIGRPKANKK